MTHTLRLACALACLLPAGAARAVQCSVSAPAVNFGAYDTVNALTPAPVTLRLRCRGRGRFSVSATLSAGSGSYAMRTLRSSGGGVLDYNLYTDAAHTQVAGDGSPGSVQLGPTQVSLSSRHRSQTVSYALYPYLPGSQNVVPGSYADTPIVVTVSY